LFFKGGGAVPVKKSHSASGMSVEILFIKNKASVNLSALKSDPATVLNKIFTKDVSASCNF